jgi:hypothetical protein
MSQLHWIAVLGAVLMAPLAVTQSNPDNARSSSPSDTLQPLSAFADIADDTQRARALFAEIGKVLQHPRCVNCHPRTERPLQGEDGALHQPLVVRGAGGMGAAGMVCITCHNAENFRNVPGHPRWHLAPAEMAWEGKSLTEICDQIKDRERNGGKTLAALGAHMANDALVAYGWSPPAHLEPAPGDQQLFGQLFHAWLEAGAHCP